MFGEETADAYDCLPGLPTSNRQCAQFGMCVRYRRPNASHFMKVFDIRAIWLVLMTVGYCQIAALNERATIRALPW